MKATPVLISLLSLVLLSCQSAPLSEKGRAPASSLYALSLEEVDREFAANATPDERKAVEALIQEMSRITNVVTREFSLFHYAPLVQIETPPRPKLTDPAASIYAAEKMEKFWSNSYMGSTAGNGLYASTDPVATAEYSGGSKFLLVVISAPKGTRFLDIRTFKRFEMTSGDLLGKVGCTTRDFLTMLGEKGCAKYLKIAMKALRLSGFEYLYHTRLDCEDRKTAFVLIDSKKMAPRASLLTSSSDLKDPLTRELAKDVFRFFLNEGGNDRSLVERMIGLDLKLWSEEFSRVPVPTSPELEALKKKYILSCSAADHVTPLSGLSAQQWEEMSMGAANDLDGNEAIPVDAVFSGKPLIQIVQTYVKASQASDQTYAAHFYNKEEIAKFCEGTPVCSFSTRYSYDFKPGALQSLKVEWRCVGRKGKLSPIRTSYFQSEKDSILKFSCKDAFPKK